MSVLILPTRTDLLEYDFQADLDGLTYTFYLRWNDRDSAWYLDVLDAEENPLLTSRKIVAGWSLIGRSKNAALPPGTLLAMDTSGAGLDPGQTDLGDRVQLLYVEAAGA